MMPCLPCQGPAAFRLPAAPAPPPALAAPRGPVLPPLLGLLRVLLRPGGPAEVELVELEETVERDLSVEHVPPHVRGQAEAPALRGPRALWRHLLLRRAPEGVGALALPARPHLFRLLLPDEVQDAPHHVAHREGQRLRPHQPLPRLQHLAPQGRARRLFARRHLRGAPPRRGRGPGEGPQVPPVPQVRAELVDLLLEGRHGGAAPPLP